MLRAPYALRVLKIYIYYINETASITHKHIHILLLVLSVIAFLNVVNILCIYDKVDFITKFETFNYSAAGRSRNDLTQYPVFPWVLIDYESRELGKSRLHMCNCKLEFNY